MIPGHSEAASAYELKPVGVPPGSGLDVSAGVRRAVLQFADAAAAEAEDQQGAESQLQLQRAGLILVRFFLICNHIFKYSDMLTPESDLSSTTKCSWIHIKDRYEFGRS